MKRAAKLSAIVLVAMIIAVWAMRFFIGPEAPPSQVVRVASGIGGCQDESYVKYGSDWDLTDVRTRERTNDFGAIEFYRHESRAGVWCVKTSSGPENRGEPKFMSDSGKHLIDYAGGVVIVVPEGRCLFVRGKVRWQGQLYQRDIATNNAGCSASS